MENPKDQRIVYVRDREKLEILASLTQALNEATSARKFLDLPESLRLKILALKLEMVKVHAQNKKREIEMEKIR